MADWICPNCRGGFKDPDTLGECPWCGQPINGSYEVISRSLVSKSDESESSSRLMDIFK